MKWSGSTVTLTVGAMVARDLCWWLKLNFLVCGALRAALKIVSKDACRNLLVEVSCLEEGNEQNVLRISNPEDI